jgi:flagellar motor switch protein FliN
MLSLDDIGHVADVPVILETVLDRKPMRMDQILEWKVGTVLWLTRSAGENIDVYIGGTLFGSGEIVIIESTFGIRLTDFNWTP